jgi:hypothetical protein
MTSRIYRNKNVFREFIVAKIDETTAGCKQSNYVVVAAAAAADLINVNRLYRI